MFLFVLILILDFFLFVCFQSAKLIEWLCCGPCIQFLKGSTAVHKMAITTATLIVTSLLVASPILFLISAAPAIPHKECFKEDYDCVATSIPPSECQDQLCQDASVSVQAKLNRHIEPCKDFKSFSCSNTSQNSLRIIKSAQEIADNQMLRKYTIQQKRLSI